LASNDQQRLHKEIFNKFNNQLKERALNILHVFFPKKLLELNYVMQASQSFLIYRMLYILECYLS
jgi:hypothetical protein